MKEGRRRRKERAREGREAGRQDEVTVALAARVSLCAISILSQELQSAGQIGRTVCSRTLPPICSVFLARTTGFLSEL